MPEPSAPSAVSHLDTVAHGALARRTGGLSPVSALLAGLDWGAHLAASPGRQLALAQLAGEQAQQLARYLHECLLAGPGEARALVEPPARDRRFAEPDWRQWPFNLWHQSFLLTQQWWDAATHGIAGVEKHHENMVAFCARQWLDMLSPGNRFGSSCTPTN